MANRKPSPLQTSFWLTDQEKSYILVICAVFLLGLFARYWYLKHETPTEYQPTGLEESEKPHD